MTSARRAAWAYALALPAAAAASQVAGFSRAGVVLLCVAAAAHAWLTLQSAPVERPVVRLMAFGAALAALLWLVGAPAYSDDVFRYLLDGQTSASGINPFAYSPNSPKVADWVSALPGEVNHPHLPTIYPAVAQGLFALNGVAFGGLLTWRLLCMAAVLGAGAWMSRRLPGVGALPSGLALIAHPLVVISAASHGHIDAFAPLVMVGMILSLRAGSALRSGAWVGVAVGLKLFPALLLPALGSHAERSRWRFTFGAGLSAALVVALAYAPLAGIGAKVLGSAGEYAQSWEYNAGPYAALRGVADAGLAKLGVAADVEVPALSAWAERRGALRYFGGTPTYQVWVSRGQIAGVVARGFGLLVWFVALACVWRSRLGFASASSLLFAVFFAFSPVVHPWYLLWIVVPALISGERVALVWSWSVLLAFWAPALVADTGGLWVDSLWVRGLEYGLVGVALGGAGIGIWRSRRAG